MSSSSPGRAENKGIRFFLSPLFLTDSLSPLNLKKTPTQPVAYHPLADAPVYPALSPDRTEAGHFHRPSLPINTEAEKRHKRGEKRRRKGTRGKNRGEEREWNREKKPRKRKGERETGKTRGNEPRENKRNRKGERRGTTERKKKKRKGERNRGEEKEETAASATLSSPAAPPATAPDGSAATPGKSSALFFFGLHFFPLHARRAQCTSAGRKKLVNVLMHSNQLMWAGLVVGSGSA